MHAWCAQRVLLASGNALQHRKRPRAYARSAPSYRSTHHPPDRSTALYVPAAVRSSDSGAAEGICRRARPLGTGNAS